LVWGVSETDATDAQPPEPSPRPALIKRRWAIVRRAGGGAALLAVAGTIAIGDPPEQNDPGADPAKGGAQISTKA
jgi:hypothetical protein